MCLPVLGNEYMLNRGGCLIEVATKTDFTAYIKLCHASCSPSFSIYTKGTAS